MREYKFQGDLSSQFGGHGHFRKLYGPVSSMAKPLLPREKHFYERIKSTPLFHCVPRYLGTTLHDERKWLILQDMTAGLSSPCVADLKIGTRTFEVSASREKICRQLSLLANTTTLTHAVRCIDICTRRGGQLIHHWDRTDGRSMSAEQLSRALRVFIGSSARRRAKLSEELLAIIARLSETVKLYPNMRLYSASVLIVYDGDGDSGGISVKLIDFGHAYVDVAAEGGNPRDPFFDDNALLGLRNLHALLSSAPTDYE